MLRQPVSSLRKLVLLGTTRTGAPQQHNRSYLKLCWTWGWAVNCAGVWLASSSLLRTADPKREHLKLAPSKLNYEINYHQKNKSLGLENCLVFR